MGCSSCGKKTTLSGGRKATSAPPTPLKRRVMNGMGSPYGSPKVRMSFSSRNR